MNGLDPLMTLGWLGAFLLLPLVAWTVVGGLGAVTLRRSRPVGAVLLAAAGLAIGRLMLEVVQSVGIVLWLNGGGDAGWLDTLGAARALTGVVLAALIHALLLLAAFGWRTETPDEPA